MKMDKKLSFSDKMSDIKRRAKKNKIAYTEGIRHRRPMKKQLFHWSVFHARLCKFLSNALIIYGELIDFRRLL